MQLSAAGPFTVQIGHTYTCPVSGPYTTWGTTSSVRNANEPASGGASSWAGLDYLSYVCTSTTDSTKIIRFVPRDIQMYAVKTGSTFSLTGSTTMFLSASFVTTFPTPVPTYTASWTNGLHPVGFPSRATFNNTIVGTIGGTPIVLTGTFILRTFTGGLLTLS